MHLDIYRKIFTRSLTWALSVVVQYWEQSKCTRLHQFRSQWMVWVREKNWNCHITKIFKIKELRTLKELKEEDERWYKTKLRKPRTKVEREPTELRWRWKYRSDQRSKGRVSATLSQAYEGKVQQGRMILTDLERQG